MNVAFDPWIPVVTLSGDPDLASLCSILTEGERYADLAVRPHERVSLMRLFLCVVHAALDGPKDYDEWLEVPQRLPDAVRKYLETWKDSFELFHKAKPWLQVAELKAIPSSKNDRVDDKSWSPLSKLSFARASGNNSTLFDHESNGGAPTVYKREEIALSLLSFQNFFVAGGKASSRLWGDVEMKNPPNPKGGPCSGKSILFTFLRGTNLIDSIYVNLNTYDDLERLIYGNQDNWLGRPLWEQPIKSPNDSESITNTTQTHLGRLVPQTRILRVNVDRKRVLLGGGFLYPKFQDDKNTFAPDPYATVVINRNEQHELLSAKPNIAIWRELHSLVVCEKSGSDSARGSVCMLNIPERTACDITVNALMTNPQQAADIIDSLESVFHISSQLHSLEGAASYKNEVRNAEFLADRLGWAVEVYRKEIDPGWEGRLKSAGASKGKLKSRLQSIATSHFWTTIEKNLSLLMNHIESKDTEAAIPTRDTWRKMLFSTACDAYRIACGQETPRQMKAFAKGWGKLTGQKEEKPPEKRAKEVSL